MAETLGKYEIVREIGRGGMGKVYEGKGPQGQRVAIKEMVLSEGLEPSVRWEVVERFQREARAARSMDHRNIIKCFDVGEVSGRYFMVLEFLEGKSVRGMIDETEPIPVERTVEIITDVCAALQYAHEQGIIHRDIKPDNIMVLTDGVVKVMDFGLANIIAEKSQTVDGTVMGTYSYMSPEQARGEKIDLRTDIFSLGATMYEMLSGRLTFRGEGMMAVSAILSQEPDSIHGLPPQVGFSLKKCLNKEPRSRFPSALELANALHGQMGQAAAGGTVMQRPGQAAAPGGTVMQRPGGAAQPPVQQPQYSQQKYQKKCPKCQEPWQGNAAACWKCGTPDPALRKKVDDPMREISSILQQSQKKKGWWPFGGGGGKKK